MRTHRPIGRLLFGFVVWPLCSVTAQAQRSDALMDFRLQEQRNWAEAAAASGAFTTATSVDVTFYHLSLEPRLTSPYLQANVLCRFRSLEDSTTSMRLYLRREFVIDSVRGSVADFAVVADTISLLLDRPFQTGDTGSVRIFYRGIPPVAGGLKGLRYVTHATNQRLIASLSTPFLAHYWWPCKDGPGDKPDSVAVDITIPDTAIAGIPVTAISNGVMTGVDSGSGKKTFHWRERYPIAPYYVMVAVSNYRDFHQAFTGTHGEQFPLDYYVFNEHLTAAQQGVADLPQVMAAFSERFGPYPFQSEKYGMTQLGFYGAIENQTNTITNNMGIASFGISVHELAHMWFGDMITCQDWHHGWLNEGFATYAEALWAEHTGGFTAYKNYVQNFRFTAGGTLYLQNISDPFGIFIPIIYDKGACVLHMLRGVLGDSVFFDCLSTYAGSPAYRFGHATTEDFQAVCETVSGRNLGTFFQQWIYDQYYPMYSYSYAQNAGTGETSVHVVQTQSALGRRPVFAMPLPLKFLYQGGGDTTVTVGDSLEAQTFSFILPHAIASMEFDPDGWILKTAQVVAVDEDAPAAQPGTYVLEEPYPNPFNGETQIRYSMAGTGTGGTITVKVYDLLGREVATLVDGPAMQGRASVSWIAAGVASGVYLCRLQSGGFVDTKKLLLLR